MATIAPSSIFNSDMSQAKFFSIFVAIVLGLYGLIGFYFLPFANYEGDLTRMAKLPDLPFLRTKEQPVINAELLKSVEWKDADILAIGDSFTLARNWQSVFAQRGVHIHTENWSNVYNICEDVSAWVRSKGFKGKVIIIENAEKYLEERLSKSIKCKQMFYHPLQEMPAHLPKALPDPTPLNYSGSMSVGIQTALNAAKLNKLNSIAEFSDWDSLGEVHIERLKNGCDLFSHARCNDVLFFNKDLVQDLGADILDNMQIINDRLSEFLVVWVVIPDKSTAYLHSHKKFWNEAEQRFHAPNVLKEFNQAIQNKTVDLYLANDTHVSTTGYLLLGNLIYNNIYP